MLGLGASFVFVILLIWIAKVLMEQVFLSAECMSFLSIILVRVIYNDEDIAIYYLRRNLLKMTVGLSFVKKAQYPNGHEAKHSGF